MPIVKSPDRQQRSFRGVDFFVGAVGERMMVTLMTFRQGQRVGTHAHRHEQAGYCVEGMFELTVDGTPALIEPHDSYIIPGGAPHSYRVLEDAMAVEMFSPPREDYL
ncbi:MAG: cupin domain-containing protein [Anaerolineae bacterium]|jgi:quercetin dioxygenase-like cupin family protein